MALSLRCRISNLNILGGFMEPLKDKTIKNICELLKNKRRINYRKNIMPYKIIFICGKQFELNKITNRDCLKKAIEKKDPKAKCIFAENLYFSQDGKSYNLLEFENILNTISFKTIIILESPGTFCELGAFVNKESKKNLVVINNNNPNFTDSFISKGPLQLVHKVIFYDGEMIKDPDVIDYINVLEKEDLKSTTLNNKDSDLNLNSLICEILHLLYIFQPITSKELVKIYMFVYELISINILNSSEMGIHSLDTVIKLLYKLDLVEYCNGYYCVKNDIKIITSLFKDTDVEKIRLQYLAHLYKKDRERIKIYVNR